jgi:hypothetical protein
MQPVSDGRLVFLASLSDGRLFGIAQSTGRTVWSYQTVGPVVESPTFADGRVYVADVKGWVHCVRAADGSPVWTFQDPHRGSFMACPAVADGRVLIGSRSGWFFALEAATGRKLWEFDAGAAICNSPAVHDGGVFWGDEAMVARRLRLTDGKEIWRQPLHGVTMRHSGPVIVPAHGVIIFKGCPLISDSAGDVVDDAMTDPAEGRPAQGDEGAAAAVEALKTAKEPPDGHRRAQERARQALAQHPEARTTFVLRQADGKEAFIAPVGYMAQHADVPPPPVAFPDGRLLCYYRGRWGAMFGVLYSSRYQIDIGWLNWESGLFERLGPFKSIEAPFGIRGDDNARLSAGGEILYGNWGSGGGNERACGALDLRNCRRHSLDYVGLGLKDKPEPIWQLEDRAGRTGTSACAPAITADGTILVNRLGLGIVALEGQK